MDRDIVINKVLYDLIERKLINAENSNPIREYLGQVYGCGFNYANDSRSNKKPVVMLNSIGEVIGDYESLTDASSKTGIPLKYISQVVTGNIRKTRGCFFKYKNI